MNDELAEKFVAILDRYEAREISAEEALIEIQIAVANDKMSTCAQCNKEFDLDEGGFLWAGLVFCEDDDPRP
jgi:hypothetical protein